MQLLSTLFLRVVAISAGCSAVLVPLLLLMPRIQKRIAAGSFYVLFLLLAVRLAIPATLPAVKPVITAVPQDYTVALPAARPQEERPSEKLPEQRIRTAAPENRISVTEVLALVWITGVCGSVLWAAGSYAFARRRLLGNSWPVGTADAALLEQLRGKLKVRRTVKLYRSRQAKSPIALGVFRPVIVLPERETAADALVLRHELTHIRRWDIAYKALLSLVCVIHWFNPAVWWMNRAAGRNLELCCDSEVVREFSEEERRRYGSALLDAAEAVQVVPFSTCFTGGKQQMKNRLQNLFTNKRNSAPLVCAVLAAAVLAGSLVACERVSGGENAARRILFQDYFAENLTEDNSSVVLADLTGDGLEEMLVLTIDAPSIRQPIPAESFTYGAISFYLIEDGAVVPFGGGAEVSSSHAGRGWVYLVPRRDGKGYALLDYRPYTGQGRANYSYGLFILDGNSAFLSLEQDEVGFQLDESSLMGGDIGDDASVEEVEAFLDRVMDLLGDGVPLLGYLEGPFGPEREFAYLNVPPEEAFAREDTQDITWLRLDGHIAGNNVIVSTPLPSSDPTSPEEALDRLELSVSFYPDGVVFRLPRYDGVWDIQIPGRIVMGENHMSVHYLEGEEWVPGRRYSFDTEGAVFDELTLWASVTGPDGTSAERAISLVPAETGS